jgi:dienelactone hydrolase
VAITLAITLVLTAAAGCGSDAGGGVPSTTNAGGGVPPDRGTTAPAAAPSSAGSPATTAVPAVAGRLHGVGVTERTFVDDSRYRTLRTRILYPSGAAPAPGSEAPVAVPDAPPADGSFPLVLFAHGYLLPADGYDRMLATAAAHGYVVAVPDLPGTSGRGGTGNRSDIVNQPADLSFVADRLIDLGASPSDDAPVPVIAHPDRLAVGGHSDGGLTATAFAYNPRYRDPRVVAAASFTGGTGLFAGRYDAADPPPLLAVHGTADTTNGFAQSEAALAQLAAPVEVLVAVEGGDHIGPYMFGTGRADLGDVLAGFFDSALEADPGGEIRLRAVIDAADDLSLRPG